MVRSSLDSHRSRGDSAPLHDSQASDAGELPVLDLNSAGPIPAAWLHRAPRPREVSPPIDAVSIDSASLLCHCPDCGVPMTVRLWLMLADCWSCGTSIELAELRRRGVNLTPAHEPRQRGGSTSTNPISPSAPHKREPTAAQPRQASPRQAQAPSRPALARSQAKRREARPPQPARPRGLGSWFRDMPAWLISLLLHLALLTLLGLLGLTEESRYDRILLSTAVSRHVRDGGRLIVQTPDDEPDFDLPLPEKDRPRTERQRRALILADQDAREIRLDPDSPTPHLPPLAEIKRTIGSEDPRRTFAARDPRVRIDVVKREGGTTLTEAAVARGLRWMAHHQNRDGRWSLHDFHRSPACRGRCGGRANVVSDSAATSLCLLPFLGAGQTHLTGTYQNVVARGLRWLIENQEANGDLRIDSRGQSGMYAHGQGAIVLCEAYAMTGDEMLRRPAQLAIDFIVEAQHPAGGWRYRPGEAGDTSVLGWQVMALQSARVAGLEVPTETLELASYYLDSVLARDDVSYSYQPGRSPTHVMTAEALLCRMYLGWTFDDPGVRQGVRELVERFPARRSDTNIYYWYYATQVIHHAGGPAWDRWNLRLRDVLVQTQERSGHKAGSWSPKGPHASAGGRIYMTALAVCTLEVYYRHAPIFRQLKL